MPKTQKFLIRYEFGAEEQFSHRLRKKFRLSFEMCIPGRKFVVMNHGYNRGQPWKTASMLIKLRSLPCRLLHALLYVIWLNRDFLYWARINTIDRSPQWFQSQIHTINIPSHIRGNL